MKRIIFLSLLIMGSLYSAGPDSASTTVYNELKKIYTIGGNLANKFPSLKELDQQAYAKFVDLSGLVKAYPTKVTALTLGTVSVVILAKKTWNRLDDAKKKHIKKAFVILTGITALGTGIVYLVTQNNVVNDKISVKNETLVSNIREAFKRGLNGFLWKVPSEEGIKKVVNKVGEFANKTVEFHADNPLLR